MFTCVCCGDRLSGEFVVVSELVALRSSSQLQVCRVGIWSTSSGAGTCLSRNRHNLTTGTGLNLHVQDGTVWHHIFKDSSGLSEPNILGKFEGLCPF